MALRFTLRINDAKVDETTVTYELLAADAGAHPLTLFDGDDGTPIGVLEIGRPITTSRKRGYIQ